MSLQNFFKLVEISGGQRERGGKLGELLLRATAARVPKKNWKIFTNFSEKVLKETNMIYSIMDIADFSTFSFF